MNKSKTNSHGTPDYIIENLNKQYDGKLSAFDPCPLNDNPTFDGTALDWGEHVTPGEVVFVNPPFSQLKTTKARKGWVDKMCEEAVTNSIKIVALLPARVDTQWFHDVILKHGSVEFIRGRITFKGSTAPAPFPCMYWRLNCGDVADVGSEVEDVADVTLCDCAVKHGGKPHARGFMAHGIALEAAGMVWKTPPGGHPGGGGEWVKATADVAPTKKKKILPKKVKKGAGVADVEDGFWPRCLECKTRIHDDDDSCHYTEDEYFCSKCCISLWGEVPDSVCIECYKRDCPLPMECC